MSQAVLNTKDSKNIKKISFLLLRYMTCFSETIFLLVVLFTVFIIGWIVLIWINDVHQLPISKLLITGNRKYTNNNDICQSILELGTLGTFMMQDVNVIQNQIRHLPWIKQVIVRKQWPDKLKIHLIEYVPIAFWNNHLMVDVDGNSFSIPFDRISKKQNLPMLYGLEGNEREVLQGFKKMGQLLMKKNFFLKEVVMTAHCSWNLTLTNGVKISLGRNNIMKNLIRFLELYPIFLRQAQIDSKRISYVDLRYNSGAAVGWTSLLVKKFKQQYNQKQVQADRQ